MILFFVLTLKNLSASNSHFDELFNLQITDEQVRGQLCNPINWEYAKGIVPLISEAVFEWSDIIPSSVITTTHRQHTIAFVGTVQGDMIKVWLN